MGSLFSRIKNAIDIWRRPSPPAVLAGSAGERKPWHRAERRELQRQACRALRATSFWGRVATRGKLAGGARVMIDRAYALREAS
jgi:hypothetical protein